MTTPHQLNLGIHIGAGIVGMLLGLWQLLLVKEGDGHRRRGRLFIAAALTVTGSAFVGLVLFRFLPLFAVLTLLVTYVSVGGWRVAGTRSAGPQRVDLAWTLMAIAAAGALVPVLLAAPHVGSSRPVVVWSALGALGFILAYDLVRWTFPRTWFRRLWVLEHIYKVVSALSGMASAFVGNVVEWGQPWSQVAPSALGMLVIVYFVTDTLRRREAVPLLSGRQ